jgi:hypothetical protein
VQRYYGSKQGLYAAALHEALTLGLLFEGGRENFGRHVASLLANSDKKTMEPVSMMVLSTADEDAKTITKRVLDKDIIKPLSAWLGPPDAEARAALITIICTGMTIYRRLLPLAPLKGVPDAAAVEWLGKALQNIVDGIAPGPHAAVKSRE